MNGRSGYFFLTQVYKCCAAAWVFTSTQSTRAC